MKDGDNQTAQKTVDELALNLWAEIDTELSPPGLLDHDVAVPLIRQWLLEHKREIASAETGVPVADLLSDLRTLVGDLQDPWDAGLVEAAIEEIERRGAGREDFEYHVGRLTMSAGDTLAAKVDQKISPQIAAYLRKNLADAAPDGVKILVIDSSIDLFVLTNDEIEKRAALALQESQNG